MLKRILSLLLVFAMVCSLVPAVFAAEVQDPVLTPNGSDTPITEEAEAIVQADIWDAIDALEKEEIIPTRADPVDATDYAELSKQVEELVLQSDTYVEGSLNRNGEDNAFFTWVTTEGIVCGYSPEVRYRTRNLQDEQMTTENITTTSYATRGGSPTSKKVYLISPYYNDSQSADTSFTDQYKKEGQSIASGMGGTFTQYGYTAATITNIATAMMNGAVVLFDSHGTTDYDNGNGNYTARANTSYLCLKTGTGITSADMQAVSGTYGTYYHAFNSGGTYCIDGTAIANHMTSNAPSSLLWMAICLGMATSGLNAPMRAKGVEVVYGYSQSVTFTGDYKYEASFWDSMLAGDTVAQAISTMKSKYGKWDPAYSSYSQSQAVANYAAFPIVVSDEDTYPGQGKVDAVQTVYSTYTLFGEGGGNSGGDDGGDTSTSITITFSCPAGVSASAINTTAGTAFTLPTPTGTPTANAYNYQFVGWATSKITDTTTAPTEGEDYFSAGTSVSANGNVTVYALYTYTSGGATYYTTELKNASGSGGNTSADIESGTYVLAAKVNGQYYAMSNTFASKISGTAVTVTDGYVSEADAAGYAITLTKSGTSYTISNGTNYLKYSSSTNLANSTTAYNWTISTGTNGSWRFTSGTSGRGLVYRAGTTNQFGGYALSNVTASSTEYYDIEILPVKASGSSGDSGESTTLYLVQNAAGLGSDTYVFLAKGSNGYYAMQNQSVDGYLCLSSTATDFTSAPTAITAGDVFLFTATYSGGKLTIKDSSGNYLYGNSSTSGVSLQLTTTAATWTPTFNSDGSFSLKSSNGYYLALRDDIDTTDGNGNPLFAVSSSLSSGSTSFYLYRSTKTDAACSHSNTSTSTVPATCTADGSVTVTCNDCGAVVSTSTIAATGHDFVYSSTVPPTTTEPGYDIYICANCGGELQQNYTDPIPEVYTVSFVVPDGVNAIAPVEGSSVTPPVPTGTPKNAPADTVFAGWVTASVDNSTTAPATIYNTNTSYSLSGNITLYALYTYGGGGRIFALYDGDPSIYITDVVLLVAADYDYAISTTQNTNNRGATPITRSADGTTITITNEPVAFFTVGWGVNGNSETGKISFKDSTGYLYAASSSGNYLRTQTTLDANGSWTFARNKTTHAITLTAQGSNTNNILQYNKSSNIFGCYAGSTQTSIHIYIEQESEGGTVIYTTVFKECQHSNTTTSTTPATCTAEGLTTVTCADCGKVISTTPIAATGHNYTSEVTTAATCAKEGVRTYTCSKCGDSYTEAIPKTNDHSYTSKVTTAATCEADGVRTYTCSVCGTSYTEAIPAIGHSYAEKVTAPTCTEDGYTTYTCANCSDSYTGNTVAATGHSYTAKVTTAATCAKEGVRTYTCSKCGDSYTEAIPKTNDHSYTAKVTTEATCDKEGVRTYTCSVCGTSYTEAIPATGHSYTAKVTEPTCTDAGYTTYTCSKCGDSYTGNNVAATGHNYTSKVTTEATCEKDGVCTYSCSVCGTSYAEAIPATGHSYNEKITDPTCTEDGYTTYTCESCGNSYTGNVVATTGHSYTYTDNGVNHTVGCAACSYSAIENHSFAEGACVCGAAEPAEPVDYSGRYYIAAKRGSESVYQYIMGIMDGTRYDITSSGLETLPEAIDIPENDKVFVVKMNEDGTYSIYAEGIQGENKYLGWSSGNTGSFVNAANALKLTITPVDAERYTISFYSTSDNAERYLSLNNTASNTYAAWYKSGQTKNLALIPVIGGEPEHVHVPAYFEGQDATCTAEGVAAYWYCADETCPDFGTCYTEEDMAMVIPAEDLVLPVVPHEMIADTVHAPTCTEDGYTEYVCAYGCGATDLGDIVPATGHEMVYTDNGDGTHSYGCAAICEAEDVIEEHSYFNGVCACGAVEVLVPSEANIKIGHALALESDLCVKYRVKYTDLSAVVPNYVTEGAYLVIEKDVYPAGGEKTVITYELDADLDSDPNRMVFNLAGIQSAEMGSELRAVLHIFDAEGKEYISAVDIYSIKTYVETTLKNVTYETQPKMVTMLIDLLNYGAAAQISFNRRTDELVNAGFEAYQQYATKELAAELTDVKETISNDRSITAVTKMGFSVNLADKTEINAKLTLAAGYTMEDISKVVILNEAGEQVDVITEFVLLEDGRVQVTFSGVRSINMRDMFYFVAYVGEEVASDNVGYSVEAAAKTTIATGTGSNVDTMRACMYYGDSACAYLNK